jgi:hypothetical protein
MGISNVYILDIVLLRMMVASQPMWVHFNNVALQKYFALGVDIALRGEQLVMLSSGQVTLSTKSKQEFSFFIHFPTRRQNVSSEPHLMSADATLIGYSHWFSIFIHLPVCRQY